MDVEIVVSGRLGDLTTWTLSDFRVEERQGMVVRGTALDPVLELLLSWDVEVVALREMPRRASKGAPTSHLVTDRGDLDP